MIYRSNFIKFFICLRYILNFIGSNIFPLAIFEPPYLNFLLFKTVLEDLCYQLIKRLLCFCFDRFLDHRSYMPTSNLILFLVRDAMFCLVRVYRQNRKDRCIVLETDLRKIFLHILSLFPYPFPKSS